MRTVFNLYIASLKEFVRDRMAMFWTLAFPILFIVLFGSLFANTSNVSFTVGVANEDAGQTGSELVAQLRHVSVFTVQTGSASQEQNLLKQGKLDMVVIIPADTSAQLAATTTSATTVGVRAPLQVYYDPAANQTGSQIMLNALNQVLAGFNVQLTHVTPPLYIDTHTVETATLGFIDFIIPGILAMSLMQLGLFATAQPLVALREEQVLRRLGATPLPRWKLLASQVMLRLTIALVQSGLILWIGINIYHVHMLGNPFELAALVALGAAAFIGLGYLIAAIAPSTESANGITQAVNMPMLFLSGIFFPLSVLPAFLIPIVKAMPVTYLADALRQVMIGSTPTFPLSVDAIVLVAWTLGTALLAIRFFRWD